MPVSPIVRSVVLNGIPNRPLEVIFASLLSDWTLFLLMLPIMLIITMFAMLLIRVMAGSVVYIFYVLSFLAFVGFGVFLVIPAPVTSTTFILKKNRVVSIVVAVFSFLISILIIAVFFTFKEKIHLVVDYINHANDFLKKNYSLLFLPLVQTVLMVFFLYFWIFLVFAFSSQTVPARNFDVLPFQHFHLTLPAIFGLVIGIFFLIWSFFFLMHMGAYIVSATLVNFGYGR